MVARTVMQAFGKRARVAVILFTFSTLTGFQLRAAEAQEIYRWVDENGVVNFSDRAPPAAPEAGVSMLTLEESRPAAYDPEQDLFNIQATLERTQALRKQLAEQRTARRESAGVRPSAAAQSAAQSNYGYPYGYPPLYPRPPFGPGGKPPPRPDQPPPQPVPPEDDTATWRPPAD
jgi:hypothetical protein